MKAFFAIVLSVVFSTSAFASSSVGDQPLGCATMVATTAVMVTQRFATDKGTVQSIEAINGAAEHRGGSATLFITEQSNGESVFSPGQDELTTQVVRKSTKGNDTYTYGATTRMNGNQCQILEITLIDKQG